MGLALAIFAAVYLAILSERVHRTPAALLGAMLVIILGVLDGRSAAAHIDWNVLFLLIGMMSIAHIVGTTGVSSYLAVEAVRLARGRVYPSLVLLALIAAVASAVLPNVTVVVLLAPVTFSVAQRLGVSPVPFLISLALASNLGGAATLIGDPPNILIGSAFRKDFVSFLIHTGPVAALSLAAYLVQARWLFRGELAKPALARTEVERLVREERRITDPRRLRLSLAILAVVIAGFVVAGPLGLESGPIALAGASLLLILTGQQLRENLDEIEWSTLLFFIGLFIVVGALEETGVIDLAAHQALALTGGQPALMAMVVLWLGAVLSAVVDNIPYTTAMVPLVTELGSAMDTEAAIWALSVGANFGGNATVVGASANIVVASMAQARGVPISFGTFLKVGLPATVCSMVIATAYFAVRELRLV